MKLEATTPVFLVSDIAATLRWYRENLQFEGRAVPEHPPHTFGIMGKDDVQIFLQQLSGYAHPDLYKNREGGVWNVYVRTQGVREWFDALSTRKAVTIVYRPVHQSYGQVEFAIRDPNGYVIVFAEPTSDEVPR
jgi:catechol 2,3-dioxygenase-like lactoylglutathione lyase family enzyme